jgi:hypothetical protein
VERYLGPSPWAGQEPVGRREPQAFLAIAGHDGGEVGVHFHDVDQFQYFVGGNGHFAGQPVGSGVVHYADHLRPYGPISPGDGGVTFLTLRGTSDHGAFYMPGAQPDLKERRTTRTTPGRNVHFDLATTPVDGAGEWTRLVDDCDGLCIGLIETGAGEPVAGWAAPHGDAYAIVVSGQVADEGEDPLGPGCFRYVAPDEVLDGLTASGAGARLAMLCLPGARL